MSSTPMSHDAEVVHRSELDRLVMMANQIGKFFAHEGVVRAPASIAEHLEQFWTRKMCGRIIAHLAEGGAGLDALPRAAIEQLAAADRG